MTRLLLVAVVLLGAACIKIEQPIEIEVTAEPVPEQLQGARWPGLPVAYCIVRSDEGFVSAAEFEQLVLEAFSHWPVASSNRGACSGGIVEGNGINEIGWGAPQDTEASIFAAGFTRLRYRLPPNQTAVITEADIIIDPDPEGNARSRECLATVLMHETGHFFGVPHLDSPAVMAPVSAACPEELTEMDIAAIEELYGAED